MGAGGGGGVVCGWVGVGGISGLGEWFYRRYSLPSKCVFHHQCPKLGVHPAMAATAHFHGWAHDFRKCAPGVCTFLELFIIAIYWEGARSNFGVHSFRGSAPCECSK